MSRSIKFKRYHLNEDKKLIAVTEWGKISKRFRIFESSELEFTMPSNVGNTDYFFDCQFTGLIDKNGMEIYEGDILVNPENKKGVVEFLNGSFCLKSKGYYVLNSGFLKNKIVVGNILENSEMLLVR
jgi:hypothetical protein